MSADVWLSKLQANGYRLTEARRAVVETVAGNARALTPLEVFDLARSHYAGLGLVTVYRTLEKLAELHLIERVHQLHGCQAFIPAGHGHEHLLICTRCGAAVHFGGDNLDALVAGITEKTGYTVQEHWLQLFGLCSNCSSEKEK